MGVYIKNIEMPENCWGCFYMDCDHWGEYGYDNTADCPLIEIDLVRCGECKHWHKNDELTYCDKIDYGYGYKADDFCSYGERRKE